MKLLEFYEVEIKRVVMTAGQAAAPVRQVVGGFATMKSAREFGLWFRVSVTMSQGLGIGSCATREPSDDTHFEVKTKLVLLTKISQ